MGGGVWGLTLITTRDGDLQLYDEHGFAGVIGPNLTLSYTRGLVLGLETAADYEGGATSGTFGGTVIVGAWKADHGGKTGGSMLDRLSAFRYHLWAWPILLPNLSKAGGLSWKVPRYSLAACWECVDDNAMKIKLAFLVLLFVMTSCNTNPQPVPIEVNFPLKQFSSISSESIIQKIAVSPSWLALYRQGEIVAFDVETGTQLWSKSVTISPGSDDEFSIIGDTLVTASDHDVIQIDRSGQERRLALRTGEKTIIRIAAVYSPYIYVIRGPDWILEAYDTSKNLFLWEVLVGRGGTDVFFDQVSKLAYITTRDHGILAVENTTGNILWKGPEGFLHSAFATDVIYGVQHGAGKRSLRLSAFEIGDQKKAWETEDISTRFVYELTLIRDLLIASEREGLAAFDQHTGKLLWQADVGAPIYTRPIEVDNIIYARDSNQTVYAFSPEDGSIIGFAKLDQASWIKPKFEALAGLHGFRDGLVFNTRHLIYFYEPR
jgi:outer membrane protein assembly factor BamB